MVAEMLSDRQQLEQAKGGILELATSPISADELVTKLKERHIDEYYVRAAIWLLVDRGRLDSMENLDLVASAVSTDRD